MPLRRISEIVHGKRAVTADTALRLGRYFDRTARQVREVLVFGEPPCDVRRLTENADR